MQASQCVKLFLLLLSGWIGSAAAQNYLSVPEIEVGQGKNIVIPVNLNNTNPVSAFQFTLAFPEGLPVDKSKIALSNRKSDHILSIRDLGNNRFQCIALSFSNAVFQGSSGPIVEIPVSIPVSFIIERHYPITLSDVIISNPDAVDITGQNQNGGLLIKASPSPDLSVSDVVIGANSVSPEGIISVSWRVQNIGDSISAGGWSEKVYLTDADGNDRLQIATLNVSDDLPASGVSSRSADILLPKLIGRDGIAGVAVEIFPQSRELLGKEMNNKATSDGRTTIEKRFFVQQFAESISEAATSPLRCILSRSGNTAQALTVTLAVGQAGQLTVPETITIPARQSGITFYITPIDNNVLEGDRTVPVTASAAGYPDFDIPVRILDSEEVELSITANVEAATEGETVHVTVTRNLVTGYPLEVSLSSGQANQWTFPQKVTIEAGNASVTFDVQIKDDETPESVASAYLKASAERTKSAILELVIIDNDVPEIAITIEPATVSEAKGANATWATVTRVTPGTQQLHIVLSASEPGQLFFPAEITLGAKDAGKKFNIGTVDNAFVDGDRQISVKASIYISSCSCSGGQLGSASADLLILDDDGPTLTASVDKGTLPEGKTAAGQLTISRNTISALSNPVTVALSHNKPDEIEIPASVTIPAGYASVNVPINTKNDGVTDGNQLVTIVAEAAGFTKGTCWVIVTDQNKPDLSLTEMQLSATSAPAESNIQVDLTVNNEGLKLAPTGIEVKLFLSKDRLYDTSDILLQTYTIDRDITLNAPFSIQLTAKVPPVTGDYYLIAYINPSQQVEELLDTNNQLISDIFTALPEYSANVTLSGNLFPGGTPVSINGKAEYLPNQPAANKEVDVYIVTNNFRRELKATADGNGNFNVIFTPIQNEAGHYYVGACYPGQKSDIQQALFDIPGIKRTQTNNIIWDVLENRPTRDSIAIQNIGSLALNNIRVEVLSAPQSCQVVFDPIEQLAGNGSTFLRCTITGTTAHTVNKYDDVKLRLISDEGAVYEFSSFFFCRIATGALKATPASINTTMIKGATRMYEFTLENTGAGETGEISVVLPKVDWMRLVSPAKVASLPEKGSTIVTLELTPTENLQLNTFVSGTIALNCTNGKGVSLPFRIETVSEETGSLLVDVLDEYTYYSESGPHVANAHVILRHPYTGQIIAQGYTNEQGLFQIDNVHEGYYTLVVQADKHEGYQNTILIDPGTTTRKNIFISFQAITYTWNVVPTEIEDQYDIQIVAKYETNVPVPVVVMEMPNKMPELKAGETYSFMITLTNKGLITAKEVEIRFPDDPEYSFTCLMQKMDLMAQQAVQVPAVMERKTALRASSSPPCGGVAVTHYVYECGDDYQWHLTEKSFTIGGRVCTGSGGGGGGGYGGFGYPTPAGGSVGNVPPPTAYNYTITSKEGEYCNPCIERITKLITDRIISEIKVRIPGNEVYDTATTLIDYRQTAEDYIAGNADFASLATSSVSIGSLIPGPAGEIFATILIVNDVMTAITYCIYAGGSRVSPLRNSTSAQASSNSNVDAYAERIQYTQSRLQNTTNYMVELLGDSAWVETDGLLLKTFMDHFQALNPINGISADSDLTNYIPSSITPEIYNKFINRWNNSVEAWKGNPVSGDTISLFKLKEYVDEMIVCENKAKEYGYTSAMDMFRDETIALKESLEDTEQSVCATVTVQFSQTLTMTREAFEGTLTISNGHKTTAMENIKLDLIIKNEAGEISNDLFQINTKALSILSGIDGTGVLNADAKGSATITFIPTKNAAPELPHSYSFGGTLSYLDPFTNEMVTRPLSPVTLQVNPSPDLYLHYFLQRDVLGDDALTLDIIEPIVPAELAVLIHNQGAGVAKNVRINSAQPKIIDNEKGLSIHFEIIGANLNGNPMEPGLTNINFGNIEAGKTGIGQWWFTSTLLGHFVSYEAHVTHLNSFGNPDLSLISGISIHELTRGIVANEQDAKTKDFLVNDIADADDTPDAIYFADGSMSDVYAVTSATASDVVSRNNLSISLSVQPSKPGWNYGTIDDPGTGKFRLTKIVRNDGREIPIDNFWQTDRTLPDGKEPIYENKLHLVDSVTGAASYTLTFTPIDQNPPAVVAIENVPQQYIVNPLQHVIVKFNKEIDPETFTYEDITLRCQGGANLSDESIEIGKITGDDVSYLVDISTLTHANGYYVLTVQAAGISDPLGNFGVAGRQASWTQMIDIPAIAEIFGLDENSAAPIDTLRLRFNMPIKPETFTTNVLQLVRNVDAPVSLTDVQIETIDEAKTIFKLSGLQALNLQDGDYHLNVNLAEIRSVDNKAGETVQTYTWTVDRTPPLVTSWEADYSGGLDEKHVTGVYVTFNEPVKPFEQNQLEFYAGQNREPISFVSVAKITPTTYFISGLQDITYIENQYTLIIKMAEIEDIYGNKGGPDAQYQWTVNRSLPFKAINLHVTPDLGFSDNDGITSTRSLNAVMEISQANITVEIYEKTFSNEILLKQVFVETPGQISVPVELTSTGNVTLIAKTINANGYENTVELPLFIDNVPPTAIWNELPNLHFCEMPGQLIVTFSDRIADNDLLKEALILTFNGEILSASSLRTEKLSDRQYAISNLNNLVNISGSYNLSIDLSKLHKYSSGLAGTGRSPVIGWNLVSVGNVFIEQQSENVLSVATAGNYQWYLDDEALQGAVNATLVAEQEGTYRVSVTNSWGCTAFSDEVNVIFDNILHITPSETNCLVYPNPTTGLFFIKLESGYEERLQVKLIDVKGSPVFAQECVLNNERKTMLNISGLSKGFYFVHISGENTHVVRKIVLR
jgi:hypothetical protein